MSADVEFVGPGDPDDFRQEYPEPEPSGVPDLDDEARRRELAERVRGGPVVIDPGPDLPDPRLDDVIDVTAGTLDTVRARLAEKREQRATLNAEIRELVFEESTLDRALALYTKAAAKHRDDPEPDTDDDQEQTDATD